MSTIFFLIGFPLVVAIALLVLKTDAIRDIVVRVAAIVIGAASIYLAIQYYSIGSELFDFHSARPVRQRRLLFALIEPR